jgi:predicted DCC family thiol-disulfide oxidoreductase YuxK
MIQRADHSNEPPATPDALWLFDGVCHICSGSVRLVLALDRDGPIVFVPIQSPYGRALALTHDIDPNEPQSFIFFDAGRPLTQSEAVVALLRRLPAPWRWLAPWLSLVPNGWRDRAYDWVAVHRYRLFGRRKTCLLPTPGERARFLTELPQ